MRTFNNILNLKYAEVEPVSGVTLSNKSRSSREDVIAFNELVKSIQSDFVSNLELKGFTADPVNPHSCPSATKGDMRIWLDFGITKLNLRKTVYVNGFGMDSTKARKFLKSL